MIIAEEVKETVQIIIFVYVWSLFPEQKISFGNRVWFSYWRLHTDGSLVWDPLVC